MSRERSRKPSVPVDIVTGFLGAGKTTLLNGLLADPAMAGTAVIINEFGSVGLDHLLVSGASDGIIELSSGCLCCTVRGELVERLEDLLRAFDNGRITALDRVIIETTGLADPIPVLQAIIGHPYLSLRYRIASVIAVVDAVNGPATLAGHAEAERQVLVADRILVTKADLLDRQGSADPLASLRRLLAGLNPTAAIEPAGQYLSGAEPAASGMNASLRAKWLADRTGHAGHHHDHDDVPAQDVNRHSDTIRAFTLVEEAALTPAALENFIDLLRSAHGPKLLRVKGLIRMTDEPDRPVLVQGAQTVFHPPLRLGGWPDADRRTRLVFITDGLPEHFVSRLFDAFAGTVRPDGADAATLRDNPLAVPGMTFGR